MQGAWEEGAGPPKGHDLAMLWAVINTTTTSLGEWVPLLCVEPRSEDLDS